MRGVFLLVFLAVFAGVMVLGQRVHAPAWLRDRVETRLDRALDGVKIRFGDASFIINEGWRPRLRLSDVSISDAEGRQIAHVSDLRASLSMRPLLRGHVRPKRIVLNGAQITLVRGPDGMLTLTVGSGSAPVRQAPNLAELIEQADAVFQSPALSALASVEMEAITLDYSDQRLGRSWVLDGGHILVTRDDRALRLATGFSVLAGRDYVSMVEANYTSTFGSPQAQFGISITDLPAVDVAAQAPALAWLQVLDAPISGALRGSIDGQGALGPVFATLNLGPGAVQPNPETRPVPFDKARTYFTYDPGRQALDFNEVSIASAWGTVQGEGEAYLEGVETGALQSMAVQVRLSGIGLNPADLFVDDLQLNRAQLDFQVSLNPFRLQLGQAVVEDDDVRLHASGAVQGLPDGWSVDLDAGINRISHRRVLQYWPPRLAPKPRKWVTENVFGGQMSNVDFALRLRPGSKPQVYADFEFDEATVRFAKTLPPLQNARGEASLIERRFAVTAHQGFVKADQGGVVDAAGTSFIIPDTGIKKSTPGIARIQARGSVTAALSLLDRPPLSVLTKAKLPVDLADGQVRLSGTLALPLIKGLKLEDTRFHFAGDILNLQSERLVPGFRVSAAKLALSGTQDEVTIAGDGSFGAVPMQVRWRQPIGGTEPQRSTLTGEIELSPRLMDELKAGLPPQMLAGQGVAQIELGIGGGQPTRLRASSDLAGVTLAIPELGWRKPPSGTGALTVEATVSEPLSIDTLRIEAAGLRAVGAISIKGGALDRIRFSTFELGDWLAVPAELIGRGAAAPDIRVLGGVLNLAKATFASGGGGGGAGPKLDVTLDRLQVTDTVALTGLTGNFQTTGGLRGGFSARVNGGAAVQGQVFPSGDGRSAVRLQSVDAGAVLRSAGLLTQAQGGTLQVQLDPVAEPGNFDLNLNIRNTRITDAPAMAALLNAISLVGLLDEMSGQGIQFSSIESVMRITPTQIKILSGSAVGPSLGLSFDGTVDLNRKFLNLQGAISPIYLVNAIGSVLTQKGEGVFAFNYKLVGPVSAPQVSVNPLSGLAPLFLRNLMRDPAPTVSDGPNAPPPRDGPNPALGTRGEDR